MSTQAGERGWRGEGSLAPWAGRTGTGVAARGPAFFPLSPLTGLHPPEALERAARGMGGDWCIVALLPRAEGVDAQLVAREAGTAVLRECRAGTDMVGAGDGPALFVLLAGCPLRDSPAPARRLARAVGRGLCWGDIQARWGAGRSLSEALRDAARR